MNHVISTKELRASLPKLVEKVRRGARFTVLYRSRPAFQITPVDAAELSAKALDSEPFYRAGPLGKSKDGLSAADHDRLLYGK
jgi:antitoxin (DNA-binding transcriptional repressor) of toxin-antitoxin stability system